MVLITASCTMSIWTSVHSASGTLSDLIPWIYLSLPLYNHKGWSSGFCYFLEFKSEFGNKELMIWPTVSSQSCFCWLYRAYPSLAVKNKINMIWYWHLVMSICRVFSWVVEEKRRENVLEWVNLTQLNIISTTVGKNPLEEMSSHHSQQKSLKCSTWMQSQKWQNNLCSFPRQFIQYHSNPSLCPNQ